MSGHTHRHHHDHDSKDLDWNTMGEMFERSASIYALVNAQIIRAVRDRSPEPRRIVDAGSGPGLVTCALAEAFPRAEVVALDSAPALLERAEQRARDAGVSDRVHTRLGELPGALAELPGTADVLWLGQSLHHVGDQRAGLAEAAGALEPGGLLVLLEGGLPARYLPRDIGIGRPGLMTRLTAAREKWFAEMRESLPDAKQEVEDWDALLTDVGLTATGAQSFLLDLPAPVAPDVREYVISTFERELEVGAEHLSAEDVATLERLLDPQDPAGLRKRPDLFLLTVQTVHFAVKP